MSSPDSETFHYPGYDNDTAEIAAKEFDAEDDDDVDHHNLSTYSTQLEELLGDEGNAGSEAEEDSEEEESFVYTGVDAPAAPADYKNQLRDVLGFDPDEEELEEVQEVERSLVFNEDLRAISAEDDEPLALHGDVLSDATPSTSSAPLPITPPRTESPIEGTPSKLRSPFLHPAVSRLRSSTPQSRVHSPNRDSIISYGSMGTLYSQAYGNPSPSASHFSAMSRMSSLSNLKAPSSSDSQPQTNGKAKEIREVFKWTPLRHLSHHLYSSGSLKASSILGTSLGSPNVLAANGLICVGTEKGYVVVYDFMQNLKCVCGTEALANTIGPVTSLALSFDHTFVASGHATGHIVLYDLKHPHNPVRSVPPTTLAAVSSGRKEGHIAGSKIVSIGFIAGRHTALVSADQHGLAFFHSLGKVLFVEASDILRILGKYELNPPSPITPHSSATPNGSASTPTTLKTSSRSRYTILGMAPLPLGTTTNPTDTYNIIALLTPTKLVVVGLKPAPRTWFKFPRSRNEANGSKYSKWRGTLAWFPSVLASNPDDPTDTPKINGKQQSAKGTAPILAFSWGKSMHLIEVFEVRSKQTVRKTRTGTASEIEVGVISYSSKASWDVEDDIIATQWLNVNQVLFVTVSTLQVYDIHRSKIVENTSFNSLSLVSPSLKKTSDGSLSYAEGAYDVAHSVRVYKGKVFLLGRESVEVGTLLTWADRILDLVEKGDFLSAIDLARSYYTGNFEGNSNGLPNDLALRKELVGRKMYDLMVSSARYAFSDERMMDGTHVTPDGRGVDRTALFENLVTVCARACIALQDFQFLFEDLYQLYEDNGISRMFLLCLEPFVLDSEIRFVPPRLTQKLVALHAEDGRPDLAERIIWHIEPECLDINQAIHICHTHYLYDALIYIYTRALQDYVAPIVELLGLIRQVRQRQKSHRSASWAPEEEAALEPLLLNAYKIYPYLTNVLSGLTYPSEAALDEEQAVQAKKDIYTFLFFGRSSVWPKGSGGKLVLTADEEGGVEPTYPYARLLLQFDAESFLHSLDIAFEDSYLNDSSQGVSRMVAVTILMEIVSSGSLPQSDVTLVNIFIARNAPKYPQFLLLSEQTKRNILIRLAQDPDPDTCDDRELAAEYLLSVYNPENVDEIISVFRQAGFYNILRAWYRRDKKWSSLLQTFLDDHRLHSDELFLNLDSTLSQSRGKKTRLPQEVLTIIIDSLPQLLHTSILQTALLVDKHCADIHPLALQSLGNNSDFQQFTYLSYLIDPTRRDDEHHSDPPAHTRESSTLEQSLYHQFIQLKCQYDPLHVIAVLRFLPAAMLDWTQVIETCERYEIHDAVVWAYNDQGDPLTALTKAENFERQRTKEIVSVLMQPALSDDATEAIRSKVESLVALGEVGVSLCLERSDGPSAAEYPLEDIWFRLLSSQIACVQAISGCLTDESVNAVEGKALAILRSLVQKTFASLVSVSSSRGLSFPRLFKRLVHATTTAQSVTGAQYTEFRTILMGMLESYHSEGDMLFISKHMVDRDLFETVEELAREQTRGWRPVGRLCHGCHKSLQTKEESHPSEGGSIQNHVIVSRTGFLYHSKCHRI